jgi:hypothetical protein
MTIAARVIVPSKTPVCLSYALVQAPPSVRTTAYAIVDAMETRVPMPETAVETVQALASDHLKQR